MNILLEGCDGTFKTTVANKLSKELGYPVVRGSSFESASGSNVELFKHFEKLTRLENTIIDRGIYSNRTYASLYDGYAILSHGQRTYIENLFKNNTIVIYLYTDKETIIDRIEERGDDEVTVDRIGDILGVYRTVMDDAEANGVNILRYNTGIFSSEDIAKSIAHIIRTTETRCKNCYTNTKTKESCYLGGHYCFSCYLGIIEELLEGKELINEKQCINR